MSVRIQSLPSDLTNLNKEFFVPTILDFELEKTTEHRGPKGHAEDLTSCQNGDPFLKPVGAHIETNRENPVLKALFGGKTPPGLSPWTAVTKTSINNCHPFKKTELSHDLSADDTPAEIPKSLLKKPSRTRKKSVKEETAKEIHENNVVLKEIHLNSDLPSSTPAASVSLTSTNTKHSSKIQKLEDYFLSKRKRTNSQVALPVSRPRLLFVNSQRLIQLRTIVDNAIKNHKIYSMTGCYNSVRNALKQRGWIEKFDSDVKGRKRINKFEEIGIYDAAFQFVQKNQTVAAMRLAAQTNYGFAHNDQIRYSGQGEAEIMNRMLKNVTEDLCWLSKPFPNYCNKDFDKFDMINRLPRAYFSNKVGLCNSLQQIQWFYECGVCSTQFPRTYNTSIKDELQAFKDDFRITACIGLLKWFSQTYKNGGEKAIRSNDGKVDLNVIEFALRRCSEFVKTKQHEDIDVLESPNVWEYQWDNFISQYYRVVNEGQILRENKEGVSIKVIANNVQSMLAILKPYWPQYDIEGYQNYWIVKPGGRCCGAGIVIKNHLEHILVIVNPSSLKETRYVVQKYIERPLLIYDTKFDIRQWFLVTNVYPLTVWMYRESYLRFCSQPFTLKNTHESIHLCNNAVQKKYKNAKRDRGLPDENMWDCYTFQTYLKAIGHPDAWDKYIYPGMKESFIGALLASQESMERKKNCFELYGADFMISETLTDGPWLIEINSNPAMDSSTSVTARMCPQVLEDVIKVVIDRRDNKSASTGAFEMVYRQNCPPIPPYLGMSLCVKGKKAYKTSGDSRCTNRKSKSKNTTENLVNMDLKEVKSNAQKIAWDTPKEKSEMFFANDSHYINNKPCIEKLNVSKHSPRKRIKTDWVKKNIEDLKGLKLNKNSKNQREQGSMRKTLTRMGGKDEKLANLKLLKTKQIIKKIIRAKNEGKTEKKNQSHLRINCVEEVKKAASEKYSCQEITESSGKSFMRFLQFCQLRTFERWGSAWKDLIEEIKGFGFQSNSKAASKSCLNFKETFHANENLLVEGTNSNSHLKTSPNSMSNVSNISRGLRRCLKKTSSFSSSGLKYKTCKKVKEDGGKKIRNFRLHHPKQRFLWKNLHGESIERNNNLETPSKPNFDGVSNVKLGLQGTSFKTICQENIGIEDKSASTINLT